MLRVASSHDLEGFTEFEEEILFDEDDPDFHDDLTSLSMPLMFRGEGSSQFLPKLT